MFTGIIEATARVIERTDSGIVLERPKIFDDLKNGCSIAISGVCLTVTTFDKKSMSFDVVPVTFQKSKLGSLKKGDSVNLERAMRADGRFDGHIVQGHCEAVGEVTYVSGAGFSVRIPAILFPFIIPHGSITVDGVALTVADLEKETVTIALIPTTLQLTTLGSLKKGDMVNIETDILGRYILQSHSAL